MAAAQDKPRRTRVLFVCMGNICRSPLAEGIFRKKAADRGCAGRFHVDSAGTGGWHAGELPDPRIAQLAKKNQIKLDSRGRRVEPVDFERFDLLICMDRENHANLKRMGAPADKLKLLMDYDPKAGQPDVPDPYYGGEGGFEAVYELLDSACEALLDELLPDVRQPQGS